MRQSSLRLHALAVLSNAFIALSTTVILASLGYSMQLVCHGSSSALYKITPNSRPNDFMNSNSTLSNTSRLLRKTNGMGTQAVQDPSTEEPDTPYSEHPLSTTQPTPVSPTAEKASKRLGLIYYPVSMAFLCSLVFIASPATVTSTMPVVLCSVLDTTFGRSQTRIVGA